MSTPGRVEAVQRLLEGTELEDSFRELQKVSVHPEYGQIICLTFKRQELFLNLDLWGLKVNVVDELARKSLDRSGENSLKTFIIWQFNQRQVLIELDPFKHREVEVLAAIRRERGLLQCYKIPPTTEGFIRYAYRVGAHRFSSALPRQNCPPRPRRIQPVYQA